MPKVQTLFLCRLIMILGDRSTVAVLNPDLSATPRSLSSSLSARTACANDSSCQDAVLHRKPRLAQGLGGRCRSLHDPSLFILLRLLCVLQRDRALKPRGLLRRHVAAFTSLKATPSLIPLMVLMDQKRSPRPHWRPLQWHIRCSLIQLGRLHPKAEFGYLCEPSEC